MVDDVYQNGVSWSGITSVEYSPGGREKTPLYTGGVRSKILLSPEEFGGSIGAYFYPDAFDQCIGNATVLDGMIVGQQEAVPFGLSYRTIIGNDITGNKFAYQLHLLYESYVTTIKDTSSTVNESISPSELNWSFESIPTEFSGYSPVSHIAIDSRKFPESVMKAIENALWGSEDTQPYLPLPGELYDLIMASLPYEGYPKPGVYPALDLYPQPT
jgi:hypothetical protein